MNLFGEKIAFRENLQFSLQRYFVWWLILIVTMIFDIFTTFVFVSKYGIGAEANMTTKLLMLCFGSYFGNIIGKILQLISVVCFTGLHRRLGNIFLLFIILLNCWAIVINSFSFI